METMTPITIDGQQYFLRFPGLVQIAIQKEAAKFLGLPAGKRMSLSDLMTLAGSGDIEAQSYMLWQGIMGGMPECRKMKFDEAVELRDKFLIDQELDDGSRYMRLLETLGAAVDASFGADRKKSQARMEAERREARLKDLALIQEARNGIGEKPPGPA